jgi:hypothetical protein
MADFRRWGAGDETERLRAAGFTRRNTRRAILMFLREGTLEGERVIELQSVTYRLQMGFLAITDRRAITGMSWAFLPFVKRRRAIPLRLLEGVTVKRRAWGTSMEMRGGGQILRVGNLEPEQADGLAQRLQSLAGDARAAAATLAASEGNRVAPTMDDPTQSQPPSDVPSTPAPAPAGGGTVGNGPSGYPLIIDATHQEHYNRFLPLVKWLLALPHYIVLFFLAIGLLFSILISWFAVVFTRKYPRALWDYNVGVMRWAWRVVSYVYLLTDKYPPFSLEPEPDYPSALDIPYPEDGVDRWRPFFAWLLAIPYLIVAGILGYLAGIVAFIGIFVILFTAKLPEGMFKLILIPHRWQLRGNAYAYFMLTKYPPFDWE